MRPSTSLPMLGTVSLFNFTCSNIYVVVSYCETNLHFRNDWWCWACLHMFICYPYIFFDEVTVQILCLFFDWIIIEFWELLIYSGYNSFNRKMTCKKIIFQKSVTSLLIVLTVLTKEKTFRILTILTICPFLSFIVSAFDILYLKSLSLT